eukprot:SAG25_NODE_540_length_7084_cov_4.278454_4_plen_68_part_00
MTRQVAQGWVWSFKADSGLVLKCGNAMQARVQHHLLGHAADFGGWTVASTVRPCREHVSCAARCTHD